MRLLFSLLAVCILAACAQEGAPPGGPPDTFPPYVTDLTPPNGSTLVPLDVAPVISFNERVDTRSLEQDILIFPLVPFKIAANWGGDRITIAFEAPLRANQTYIITIGAGARDIRGNRMAASLVYALSTGPVIDRGEISGVVATGIRYVPGAYVWAYNVQARPAPNPADTPPDYIVQAGQDGTFAFSNLSPGVYRLFAFQDRGRDRRYDDGLDPLGVPPADITLTEERRKGGPIRLELAVRDSSALRVQSVRAISMTQVSVRFNRPVREERLDDTAHYRISAPDALLSVVAAYRDPADSAAIILVTEPQMPAQTFTLTLSGISDQTGLPLASGDGSGEFAGASASDTSPPALRRIDPPDSARHVPLSAVVRVLFSEAVRADPEAVMLTEHTGRPVPVTLEWTSPVTGRIRPDTLLAPDTAYRIMLIPSRIRDYAGHALQRRADAPDTVLSVFTTVDPAIYGTVSGVVADGDSTATGPVSITLLNAQNRYETWMPLPGSYRFDRVLPGVYTLYAFRDASGNGRLDLGSAAPYIPSERTAARTDSILVRAGWESEGADLRFPP
jgi:uncharacterized protein (DUF2141 family)